jgi:hypothetical protein
MVRNEYIFETVTNTNMKQLENVMETHKVYLEMFDMCSISYSANVNAVLEFSSCTPQLTHQRWLCPVKFVLEGMWHRKLVCRIFHISPYIEVARSKARDLGGQEVPHSHLEARRSGIHLEMELPREIFL